MCRVSRPSALRLFRPGAVLALGLLLSGCMRDIVTGPGASGGVVPGSAGGKPGFAADVTVSPDSTIPSQPNFDPTPGQTVAPLGSGPGGNGMPYP